MVGDGHAMGVAAEILQDIWGGNRRGVSSRPPSPVGSVVAARRRRSWVEQEASGLHRSGAGHPEKPARER